MPSFDIASKLDAQLLDNAINVAKKDILNRWDFRDSKSTIELNKKEKYWIKILKANEKSIGYNIAEGGNGGFNGGMKPETKEKQNKS
jgi:uncharacterized protein YajQ (UPF0234 family)